MIDINYKNYFFSKHPKVPEVMAGVRWKQQAMEKIHGANVGNNLRITMGLRSDLISATFSTNNV